VAIWHLETNSDILRKRRNAEIGETPGDAPLRTRTAPKGAARTRRASQAPAKPRAVKSSASLIDDVDERRGGVQSIGRAFAILEEIARNRDGIGLAELSKRVGLHNSTAFHLVKTMVSLGYVRQLKDKRYRVGRPLFALAASSLDDIEMVALATPVLEDLSRETGESGHFAVRMGDAVVVLARTGGAGAFQLTDRVGVVRPAHCTALGKVILAGLRPEQLDRFIAGATLDALTPKSITDADALRREVEEVQRIGIAFDDGEFDPELRCVAVPVRDFTGQVAGAIGMSGPVWRLSMQALQSRARLVEAAAARLSADFGAPRLLAREPT
jgi:DNA-binding IclR family transcriptional regulator